METLQSASKMFQVAEIELVYNVSVKASQRPKISSAKDAYKLLLENWNLSKIDFLEEFKIMLLNEGSRVLGIITVSTGGLTGTVADVRVIFAAALKGNATGIILAHNHPSGQLHASRPDKVITSQMVEAGKLLNIKVVDHLIVTSEGFLSFSEECLL
jgi:DNA repair protein RadC